MQIAATGSWQSYRQAFSAENGSTNAGSASNPYIIDTPGKLAQLTYNVTMSSYAGIYFKQTADINLGGHEWVPIGTESNPFQGNYDGQNHKIHGVYTNQPEKDYVGLFGYLHTATINNIIVNGGTLVGRSSVGGIAGFSYNTSFFNCINEYVSITSTGDSAGGIVGLCDTNGISANITNCSNSGKVVSQHSGAGGISGNCYNYVYNCVNWGDVVGADKAGGIAGNAWRSIHDCINYGLVSGDTVVGGIYASGYSAISGSIVKCALVAQSDDCNIGGLIGEAVYINTQQYCSFDSNSIECYIQTLNSDRAGLFVGYIGGAQNFDMKANSFIGASNQNLNLCGDRSLIAVFCYSNCNNMKQLSSNLADSTWTTYWAVVPNMNDGLPIQKNLYSVAEVANSTIDDIKAAFRNHGFSV